MQEPHTPEQTPPPSSALPRQKAGSVVAFKRELRRAYERNKTEPEVNFLNITAMMDMMTIILVFLLKTMTSSTAAIPMSKELQLPRSVITKDTCVLRCGDDKACVKKCSSQNGVPVIISKTNIVVDKDSVCPVPANATHGIEARYKRSGSPDDTYIVPLANALKGWRDRDRQFRQATGKDASGSEAIVIADSQTPYRLLVEVLFTLGQTEFNKYHLMVLQGKK